MDAIFEWVVANLSWVLPLSVTIIIALIGVAWRVKIVKDKNKIRYTIATIGPGGSPAHFKIEMRYVNENEYSHILKKVEFHFVHPVLGKRTVETIDVLCYTREGIVSREGLVPAKSERRVTASFQLEDVRSHQGLRSCWVETLLAATKRKFRILIKHRNGRKHLTCWRDYDW